MVTILMEGEKRHVETATEKQTKDTFTNLGKRKEKQNAASLSHKTVQVTLNSMARPKEHLLNISE